MNVIHRTVVRDLDRSASIARRLATSSWTASARSSSAWARPGPRSDADRISAATTLSAVTSSRVSPNARSASAGRHPTWSRSTRSPTSCAIGSGAPLRDTFSASSRPRPSRSTFARRCVQSPSASRRPIRTVAPLVGASSHGTPTATRTTSTPRTNTPVTSHSSAPRTPPAANRVLRRLRASLSAFPVLARNRAASDGPAGADVPTMPTARPTIPPATARPHTTHSSSALTKPPVPAGAARPTTFRGGRSAGRSRTPPCAGR